jgi:DNA sulfur modification protein DndE
MTIRSALVCLTAAAASVAFLAHAPAQASGSDGEAEITLIVPDGAEVFFSGKPTTQTGTERRFTTPTLTAGKVYYYDVVVRWREDGKAVERTKKIEVRAGDRIRQDFTASSPPDPGTLTEDEAFKLGTEAYIYGYPLVTMDVTRRVMTNVAAPEGTKAPMFQFANLREYPTAAFKDVTAPNADTLYSAAWLHLAREPWILHVPDVGDRYYLMPMLSGWTNVFDSPGTRTTGTKAGDYAICGPGWTGDLPDGVKRVQSPTNMVWIIGRTYSTGTADDLKAVHAIQDKYSLTPLSAWGKDYKPPASVLVAPGVDVKTPPRDQVNKMDAGTYFKALAVLLRDNPPAEADAPMVAKLAKLGFAPGKGFDIGQLNPAAARGLERAVKAGLEQIVAKSKKPGKTVNGWQITFTGDYGTDYLFRAAVTFVGLGANLPQDAVYPTTGVDAAGKELTGANRYTLHFASKKDLPPVNAFWSLTMYNADFFFVDNPLNRYTLSQRNELKENADGSIDLYLQKDSPGKDKESNWLPAPEGKFNLMLRLYWPKESFLDGTWKPPAVTAAP